MNETPFFLANGSYELFAVRHDPASGATGEAWVFCHPLAEEKLWAHRVFVAFARRLAGRSHAVVRVDFMGNGDSDGGFESASVETALSDVRCAIDHVRGITGASQVNLMGLRFGATIASLAAERSTDVSRLILWAPVVDGERYMQEVLRTNVATQMAVYKEVRYERTALVDTMRRGETVNVDGYEMSFPLYAEAAAIKLDAAPKRHRGETLVVQIDRQPGRPSAELQRLAGTYEHGRLVFAQEEPFWKEIARSYLREAPNLFAVTESWLDEQPA